MEPLPDPNFLLKLVVWGGWLLAFLGALKMLLYLVGEFLPRAYARIPYEGLRRFLTGTANRLLFGLGGCLTLLLGLFFVLLGVLLLRLDLGVGG